jgi:hypothetical protein
MTARRQPQPTEADAARFWAKVDTTAGPDGCWPWTAGRFAATGYGAFAVNRMNRLAHRVAYELVVDGIPPGLQLDHVCHDADVCQTVPCDHRRCVNPAHLRPVTARENNLRGRSPAARNAVKSHCPQGHPYAGDNLTVSVGRRVCRACSRARCAQYRDALAKVAAAAVR